MGISGGLGRLGDGEVGDGDFYKVLLALCSECTLQSVVTSPMLLSYSPMLRLPLFYSSLPTYKRLTLTPLPFLSHETVIVFSCDDQALIAGHKEGSLTAMMRKSLADIPGCFVS